ncbi:hypothetical protein BDZ45DRAFT_574719, partial [Acephala macrosclerotiorum]
AFSLGPAKQETISTTTTIYPGQMPSDQAGYLFVWLGISNGTGDLIQSIIGPCPAGQSECSGSVADSTRCISSEVYGLASNRYPNQWLQTIEGAVTGELLSSFNKTSGPMLGWGTAIECNDYIGVSCTSTIAEQYYVNSTIILENTDDTFVDTLGVSSGATHTDMVTADNGKTWAVSKIMIP